MKVQKSSVAAERAEAAPRLLMFDPSDPARPPTSTGEAALGLQTPTAGSDPFIPHL